MVRSRLEWMDALKLYTIFLVLWGHSIQHFLSSEYYDEPVYRFIYSFHMPLFMTISGFFGAKLVTRKFTDVLIRKSRQLLLPGFSFGLIMCIFIFYRGGVFPSDWLICSFWFLKSAFLCSIYYYLCAKYRPIRYGLIVAGLALSQCISVYQFNYMYPCFILGVCIARNFEWVKKHDTKILLISGSIFVFMSLFWDERFWQIPESWVVCAYVRLYKLFIGFAGAILFITMFEIFSRFMVNNRYWNWMARWGRYTLGIYILQVFVLEIFLAKYLNFDTMGFMTYNFLVAPLISLGVLLLCLGCIRLIHVSRIASLLLLGEKI